MKKQSIMMPPKEHGYSPELEPELKKICEMTYLVFKILTVKKLMRYKRIETG